MLTILIVGSGQEDRLQAIENYRQKFQLVLDGNEPENRTIEAVRRFQKSINFTSNHPRYHLILEAQNLSLPAQQALLKTLEEPPTNATFVLTAPKTSDLPSTIVSRCQVQHLNPTLKEIAPEITTQAKRLLKQITQSNHAQLISLAEGLSKDQRPITDLLTLLQNSLRQQATTKRASAVQAVQNCLLDLTTNIQPQLSIENLLFSLKSLT